MNFPESGQILPVKTDVCIFLIYKKRLSHAFAARVISCFWTRLFVYMGEHIWKVDKLLFFIFNQFFFQFYICTQKMCKKNVSVVLRTIKFAAGPIDMESSESQGPIVSKL